MEKKWKMGNIYIEELPKRLANKNMRGMEGYVVPYGEKEVMKIFYPCIRNSLLDNPEELALQKLELNDPFIAYPKQMVYLNEEDPKFVGIVMDRVENMENEEWQKEELIKIKEALLRLYPSIEKLGVRGEKIVDDNPNALFYDGNFHLIDNLYPKSDEIAEILSLENNYMLNLMLLLIMESL